MSSLKFYFASRTRLGIVDCVKNRHRIVALRINLHTQPPVNSNPTDVLLNLSILLVQR